MADPRGIVKLGKFELRLPINRICDMEADFSETRGVEMDCRMIGASLENAGFRAIRKVVFHALADRWNDKDGELTEERAGEAMQEVGLEGSARAVGELWRATFPQPEETAAGDDADEDADQDAGEPTGNRAQRRAAKSKAGNGKPKT